jgi:hypothetical protein
MTDAIAAFIAFRVCQRCNCAVCRFVRWAWRSRNQVESCPHCGGICDWNIEHEWRTLDCRDCGALVRRSEW